MKRSLRNAVVRAGLLASLLAPAAVPAAEADPTQAAFERARRTLRLASASMLDTRDRASSDLPRFTYADRNNNNEVRFSRREVDAVFAKALADSYHDSGGLEGQREAWLRGQSTLDEFYAEIYRAVQAGIGRHWDAQIAIARDGYIVGLRHRAEVFTRRQYVELDNAVKQIRATRRPDAEQLIQDFQRRQSLARREAFQQLALEYRQLKDRLARLRADWAAETWRWVDFAAARGTQENDVHRRAAAEFARSVVHYFGYREEGASTLWFFMYAPGSPDRIITTWNTTEWSKQSVFPDIEPSDMRGVLKMNEMGRVPTAQLRPQPSELPVRFLEAASIGFAATDAELPARQAPPNALVRVVARVNGTATTDANRAVRAVLANGTTGQRLELTLGPWGRLADLFVSDPIHIAPAGADPASGLLSITACPGEVLLVQAGGQRASMPVVDTLPADDTAPCSRPELPPRYSLTAASRTQRVFDPENLREYGDYITGGGYQRRDPRGVAMIEPPTVLFRDENGRPLPNEAIAWTFPDRKETLVSYTDANGVARLDFRVGARGTFAAFIDGMPTSDPIADGVQRFYAMPADPVITRLLTGNPVRFEIDFVRPTVIDFIDKSGSQPGALVSGENFFVRVYLGRHDAQRYGAQASIQVRIDPPIQLRDPMLVEAVRQIPNIYESQVRTGIRTKASAIAALQPGLWVDPYDTITVGFGQAQVGIQVFPSHLDLAESRINAALVFWRDALASARRAGGPEAARVALVAQLVDNALGWLHDPRLQQSYRVAAAGAYFGLLEKSREQLGANASPEPMQAYNSAQHPVHARAEWEAVSEALNEAHRTDPALIGNRLTRVGGAFVDFVVNIPDMLFVQPVLSGYTAITGWTAEGELATTFERVLGGFDALLALAEAPSAIIGTAARGASAIRAAGRAGARAVIGEGLLAGSLSLAGSLAASSGSALARQAPQYIADAALQIALEEMVAEAPAGTLVAEAGGTEGIDWTRPVLVAQLRRTRVERLTDTIQRRARYAEERGAQLWEAKSRLTRAAQGTEEFRRLEARVTHLEKVIARHEDILLRAQRSLGMAQGRNLTLAELEARRPNAKALYKGSPVHTHYEWQVGGELKNGMTGMAAGWEPGGRLTLPTAYRSVLPEGFLTTMNPTEFTVRKTTRKAIPDHLNRRTFEVGDSKYYDFSRVNTAEKAKLCAEEINDTINKARLVQTQLIEEEMKRLAEQPNAVRTRFNRFESGANAAAEARKRRVYIFTPEPIPPSVMQWIHLNRALQGEAMGTIVFRTVRIDPKRW